MEEPYQIIGTKLPQGAKVLWFYLRINPGVHGQEELAKAIGGTSQSVNKYVRELKANGWITVERPLGGRRFFYDIT